MKIVCISDTHGKHEKIKDIPSGDVLVHAGDITPFGQIEIVGGFNEWLGRLPHKHKIVIAGNHDRSFENYNRFISKEMITNATYLEDSEVIIEGIKFYGSPWQPEFCNWAFNLPRGKLLAEKWSMIPDDVNVLITHSPPSGILDLTEDGVSCGCEDLLNRIKELTKLKCHIFGHIHEDHGTKEEFGIKFINASSCDFYYQPINKPIVFNI